MCGAPEGAFKVLGTRLNRSQGRNPAKVRGAAVTIVRCGECGLVFPDPQPIPASLHDHYDMPGEEYWNDNRASPEADPDAVERFSRMRGLYPLSPAPTALDVGVGSGFTAKAMIAAGFDFQGFEPIPQFRQLALKSLGLPEDRIALAGIEDADYPPESFDLINFGAVLEHLYDPDASLAKAIGWLRSGGRIVLEVPSSDWLLARLINRYFRLRGTAYVTNCSPMHSPYHLYEFTAKSFALHGKRRGYRVEELRIEPGIDPTLPAMVNRILSPVMATTDTGMMLHAVLQKL